VETNELVVVISDEAMIVMVVAIFDGTGEMLTVVVKIAAVVDSVEEIALVVVIGICVVAEINVVMVIIDSVDKELVVETRFVVAIMVVVVVVNV
jgi:hypothetical protein